MIGDTRAHPLICSEIEHGTLCACVLMCLQLRISKIDWKRLVNQLVIISARQLQAMGPLFEAVSDSLRPSAAYRFTFTLSVAFECTRRPSTRDLHAMQMERIDRHQYHNAVFRT